MSTAAEVRIALEKRGQGTVVDIAAMLDIRQGDPGYHSVGQALSTGVARGWAERVGRAEYAWANGSPKPTSNELQGLVDSLSDEEFDLVGLTYVGRGQDGAFICTDRNGVVWQVEVTATARLI